MEDFELQRCLDELAIRAVLVKYARGVDRMDWELLRSCYHVDAIDDHGIYNGPIEGFIEFLQTSNREIRQGMHLLGVPLIELDGDVAWSETYGLSVGFRSAGDGLPERWSLLPVRYCDRFERRDGEWRIAHRICAYEPGRIDPAGWKFKYTEDWVLGVPGKSDPAYRRLREQHVTPPGVPG